MRPSVKQYEQQLSRGLCFKKNVLITRSPVTPVSSVFILIAAVIGMFVACCCGSLSSALPITGGENALIASTFGKPWGFALLLLTLVGGIVITASGAGEYLGGLLKPPGGSGGAIVVINAVLASILHIVRLVAFNILVICTSANIRVTDGLIGIAALVGRINKTTSAAEYRMKLWPFAPVVMAAAAALIFLTNLVASRVPVAATIGIVAVGVAYYLLYPRPRLSDWWALPNPVDEERV